MECSGMLWFFFGMSWNDMACFGMFWLFPPTVPTGGCSRAGTTEKMENACAIMNFRFCCAILDFASLRMCLTLDLSCCLHNVCNILKVASLICEVIKEQINKNTEAAERKQKQNNRNTRAEQPEKHMNNEQQEH